MNTYRIIISGKEDEVVEGVNVESALKKAGFVNHSDITPSWRGTSNGKYIAWCDGRLLSIEWVEKINSLNNLVV